MVWLFSILLLAIAVILSIPAIVLLGEVCSAVTFSPRILLLRSGKRQRIAVLVPAHNESEGILSTIRDLKPQLGDMDRIIVVADNCTDDTATVAASAGTEVIERHDLQKMGKGFALECGIQHLAADPPDVVVVVDADCKLAPDTLDQLSIFCVNTQRPVQALDLMLAPADSPTNQRVAEFAWRIKNWVRPLGLSALNLPCHLMGTGMAFPWSVIKSARLASDDIAEDLKLGIELALAGHPALFCPTARVESYFPLSREASIEQRRRWEQGHLSKILGMTPRLICAAFKRGNLGLLILGLDLAVPPLTLLGVLLTVLLMVSSVAAYMGLSAAPFLVSSAAFAFYAGSIFLCLMKYGEDIFHSDRLSMLVSYSTNKLSLYYRMMMKKRLTKWERTEREK